MARILNLLDSAVGSRPAQAIKAHDILVEVLHGNQPASKHSRRRSDQVQLAEHRALDWGSHTSDIALFPHSPLALADVLSETGGFLDLIPMAQDEPSTQPDSQDVPEPDSTSPAVEIDVTDKQISKQRGQRDRFNLLTRHTQSDLLKQCKKILVENALIKTKGERQLYLTAGFICWPDAANTQEIQRAPLLLYPALLVRVPGESRYEIRLAGELPEFNQSLVLHMEQRFGVQLPIYDEQRPLTDFFAQVASSINHSTTLTLEFDVALGTAALFHGESDQEQHVELPDVPINFDVALAMSITGNKNLMQLSAVLQLIPDYTQTEADAAKSVASSPTPDTGIAALRKYAARLAGEGLDRVEFRQLAALPAFVQQWSESVTQALGSDTVNSVLSMPDITTRELIRLASIIELIDKAPENIEHLSHGDLCYAGSTVLLRRAQHQAKLIEDELAALQAYFVLDKVPPKSQLLSLMSELGDANDHEPDLVDADYFSARRQFMEFSTDKPANLTLEHRRLLSQLAKVLRFRELFVNNTEYRSALGAGYKGLRTDWTQLAKSSEYARELAEVLESETIAAEILRNWKAFRSAYSVELDTLQTGAEASRRLLGTFGTRWQSQTAAALVVQSQLIVKRLQEWQLIYGTVDSHAEKTPASVLSSFSGKSREDMVVETQVDETRNTINQQLHAGEISREQITDTLRWLQEASSTAAENELDIDAIVEHLQIA